MWVGKHHKVAASGTTLVHLRYSLVHRHRRDSQHTYTANTRDRIKSKAQHQCEPRIRRRQVRWVYHTAQAPRKSGVSAQSANTLAFQASRLESRENNSAMDGRRDGPWSRKASRDVARIREVRYNNVRQAYTIAWLNSLEQEGPPRDPTRRRAACDSQHRVTRIQAPSWRSE